ncbi:GNAT family protein [uncultured Ferrimonas sp.]|uniref:GNAT family N-acetyltransferase n=1 Tax=uncultured Ferrimonas sp. TaxID=432640 RepID=UPI0026028586|nr:GNAT family protein [uncultured Ferrimonas sp.]
MPGILVARSAILSLHQFAQGDACAFKAMNDQPQALAFTGDKPFPSEAAAAAFIRDYDHYHQFGFGRWSIYLTDGRYAGFCGLRQCVASNGKVQVDLGYRVPPALWGQGIATTAASMALRLGFIRFGLNEIVANVMVANPASVRVLSKLGMRATGRSEDQHGQWLRFSLSQQQWLSQSSIAPSGR